MSEVTWIVAVLAGLQAKHFVADYLLQTTWMIEGKASLRRLGGYVHAGTHAFGSILVFAMAGLAADDVLALALAEAVVHYTIDFTKARAAGLCSRDPRRRSFWALHGGDQLAHHLTYASLLGWALASMPLVI